MQNTLNDDLQNILKQGWLQKRSRILKSYRRRWAVLTKSSIYTFKKESSKTKPTEIIPLNDIQSVKPCDDETKKEHSFVREIKYYILKKIVSPSGIFYLVGSSNKDKENWVCAIGKQMVKMHIRKHSFDCD